MSLSLLARRSTAVHQVTPRDQGGEEAPFMWAHFIKTDGALTQIGFESTPRRKVCSVVTVAVIAHLPSRPTDSVQ